MIHLWRQDSWGFIPEGLTLLLRRSHSEKVLLVVVFQLKGIEAGANIGFASDPFSWVLRVFKEGLSSVLDLPLQDSRVSLYFGLHQAHAVVLLIKHGGCFCFWDKVLLGSLSWLGTQYVYQTDFGVKDIYYHIWSSSVLVNFLPLNCLFSRWMSIWNGGPPWNMIFSCI